MICSLRLGEQFIKQFFSDNLAYNSADYMRLGNCYCLFQLGVIAGPYKESLKNLMNCIQMFVLSA